MRLSEHFSLNELTNSATAAAQGLPNTPDVEALANLSRLATTILEPVRALLGVPCRVTSGYRSPEVNAAIPEVTGRVESTGLVERANAPTRSANATGDSIETDGKIAVVVFSAAAPNGADPAKP